MLLLDRDRENARSRVEKAERDYAAIQRRYEEATAASDKAFDRWERTGLGSPQYDERKQDALAKGSRATRECASAIGAAGLLTDARRVLAKLDDPAELERRLGLAREHDTWWKGGT